MGQATTVDARHLGGEGIVADWKDAKVVPVLKNRDIHGCDNWYVLQLL